MFDITVQNGGIGKLVKAQIEQDVKRRLSTFRHDQGGVTMLRAGWNRLWAIGAGLCLATVLALFVSAPVDAGLVSGRVNDERGRFPSGGTFSVRVSGGKTVQVKTDADGNYRVFLPPGIYTVEFPDGRRAEILSHPEPIKQDIRLK